jgi:hypothetical protein
MKVTMTNEFNIMENKTTEFEKIIFTRYLYSKIDVKQSLLLALLEHQLDESMFWAYELYYSGFQKDCLDYVINIYEEIYSFDNPGLRNHFQKIINLWTENNSLDWYLGTIVMTLVSRNYTLKHFMKSYFNFDCIEQLKSESKNNLVIYLKEHDIEKYQTITVDRPWKLLRIACKYSIRKEANDLFKFIKVSREEFQDHWLYYCKETPFWVDKIIECDGQVNDDTRDIVFSNTYLEESFYNQWNLEPDEQPLDVIEKCIGKSDVLQLSVMDFCKKYGGIPVLQKIKISVKVCR